MGLPLEDVWFSIIKVIKKTLLILYYLLYIEKKRVLFLLLYLSQNTNEVFAYVLAKITFVSTFLLKAFFGGIIKGKFSTVIFAWRAFFFAVNSVVALKSKIPFVVFKPFLYSSSSVSVNTFVSKVLHNSLHRLKPCVTISGDVI